MSVRRAPGNGWSLPQGDNAHECLVYLGSGLKEIQLAFVWASTSQLGKHLHRLVMGSQATCQRQNPDYQAHFTLCKLRFMSLGDFSVSMTSRG